MRHIYILLTLSLALITFAQAQDNPFEKAAPKIFSGRFVGPESTLRLKPDNGKFTGTLIFHSDTYPIQGENKDGSLVGTFGKENSAFIATCDKDEFTLAAGTLIIKLQRQKLPQFTGRWGSSRVEIIFENSGEKFAGKIRFDGNEFPFTAAENGGDLEGFFKTGDKPIPFSIANEPRGLIFLTGAFSERVVDLVQVEAAAAEAQRRAEETQRKAEEELRKETEAKQQAAEAMRQAEFARKAEIMKKISILSKELLADIKGYEKESFTLRGELQYGSMWNAYALSLFWKEENGAVKIQIIWREDSNANKGSYEKFWTDWIDTTSDIASMSWNCQRGMDDICMSMTTKAKLTIHFEKYGINYQTDKMKTETGTQDNLYLSGYLTVPRNDTRYAGDKNVKSVINLIAAYVIKRNDLSREYYKAQ